MAKYKQVLLLGNGINRAFDGFSWQELLAMLNESYSKEDVEKLESPAPLQAILVTRDHVDTVLKEHKKELFGTVNSEQREILRKLLSIKFDAILTTNYSYELEIAAQEKISDSGISEYRLKKLLRHSDSVKKAEPRYSLYTYNEVSYNGVQNKIWHIHGEARKPSSIVLGHYYYANYIGKLHNLNRSRENVYSRKQKAGEEFPIKSWFDAFVLGDVHVLGFGFDFSEMDLWWLLNRKKREKADHGKVCFYDAKASEERSDLKEKYDLLKMLGVKLCLEEPKPNNDWKSFYWKAIEKIEQSIKRQVKETMKEEELIYV